MVQPNNEMNSQINQYTFTVFTVYNTIPTEVEIAIL